MPHIIRDAEFKTSNDEGLWPGMWVHTYTWQHPRREPSALDACYVWRVEQHDGVMVLVGQGAEAVLPLTNEIAEECVLFKLPLGITLADYPEEWAALRKLGWGVHFGYEPVWYQYSLQAILECQRGNQHENFVLPRELLYKVGDNAAIMSSFLQTAWWRLKHPKYAAALRNQQPKEFWQWPNTPALKELHQLGVAAFRTQEGRVEITPEGKLSATGRKAWDFPIEEEPEQD
jgi:hypothetical protein